jgi:hypothetical protein
MEFGTIRLNVPHLLLTTYSNGGIITLSNHPIPRQGADPMNATCTRRRILPVRLEEATLLSKPICCCEMIPAGVPGLVSINGATYTLALNATLPDVGEPIVHGYRLTSTESYKTYDLPHDLSTCDCPDWFFRRNTVAHPHCKHQLSLRQFREAGKLA